MIHLVKACSCEPCRQCCSEWGFACGNFFHKPLGPYVILAMLLSAAEVGTCLLALIDERRRGCQLALGWGLSAGLDGWLYVQFGTACLNLIFAPYIQYRVWQNLQDAAAEVERLDAERQGPSYVAQLGQRAFFDVPRHKVKEAFWDVFWYDIGVCGYALALLFSGLWSYLGSQGVSSAERPAAAATANTVSCDPEGHAGSAALIGLAFMVFVVLYFCCFACYLRCVSSLEVNPAQRLAQKGTYVAAAQPAAAAHGMPAHGVSSQKRPFAKKGRSSSGGGNRGPATTWTEKTAPTSKKMLQPECRKAEDKGASLAVLAAETETETTKPATEPVTSRSPWERVNRPQMLMKLLACLCLDLMGDATYLLPGLDEELDLAYAPAMAVALKLMFQSKSLAGLGFTEEILPGTDVVPTATLGWLLEVFAPDNGCTRAVGIRSDANP